MGLEGTIRLLIAPVPLELRPHLIHTRAQCANGEREISRAFREPRQLINAVVIRPAQVLIQHLQGSEVDR